MDTGIPVRRMLRRGIPFLLLLTLLCGACASSTKKTASPGTSTGGAPAAAGQPSTALGPGVTPTTVKIGVTMVDFNCIKPFVEGVQIQQQEMYQLYIDYVNAHGGLAGHQIQPVYETYCPIGNAQALALCTKLTEDDKVFAVIGNLVDFSGDAQTCVTKDHHTPLITFTLTKAIIDQSPPGLIVYPGSTPERIDTVLSNLMQKQRTLSGKKVGVLGETTSQNVVNSSVIPALKKLGVATGSTAILNITNADTAAAQAQLDSFIERWKTEHVDALFVTGGQVSSQQFVEKVRARMPNVTLITDDDTANTFGQEEQTAGRRPNPYEGILIAAGQTDHEYDQSANWKYCQDIYQHQTGRVPPNRETVEPKGPDGKVQDLYGSVSNGCQDLAILQQIGDRAGKDLNADTWAAAVNSYGPIRDVGGGQFASLHMGKYDTNDTYRLEAFDSSIPPHGNWRPLTALENIAGT
jgi:ABC-type branched-subunit amino acid transport system substrate-binding protein